MALDAGRTQVFVDVHAEVSLPRLVRPLADAVVGRRVRALHVKDVDQLERHVEAASAAA